MKHVPAEISKIIQAKSEWWCSLEAWLATVRNYCVHADPGGSMCIIYFLYSKCDTFSLLANTHDPKNRFQKLNEIHRRRFSHWNYHTDLLTFVARSHHSHQALAIINDATNDSLANWIVLLTLTYPVLLVKALRLLIQLQNCRWVTDLCPTLTAFSVT